MLAVGLAVGVETVMGSTGRWMIQSVSRLVLETPLRSVVGCGEMPSIKNSVGENKDRINIHGFL